jgi:two-component system, NarL family, invasion response regulator UvrY
MTRILIADDHAIVRKGLVQILNDVPETIIIDEAENGVEALNMALNNTYDLVLLDIAMPGKRGLEVLQELRNHKPELPVMMLSMHPEEQYAVQSLRAGASGYLTKESAPDELAVAIKKVLSGGKYISASLAEKLAFGLVNGADRLPHEKLSAREDEVMRMIAAGKPTRVIAGEMALSVKTVSTFRARILHKMNMKSNAELTQYVIQNRLLG